MKIEFVTGGMATHTPGAALAQRTMKDFEFVWMIRGRALWRANGREHAVEPGGIILSQPGFVEGYRWDPETATRHGFFHFLLGGRMARELGNRAAWPLFRQMPEGDVIRPLFNYVLANTAGGKAGTAVEAAIGAMLAAFVVGPVAAAGERVEEVPEAVHRAIQFAAQTLGRKPAAAIRLEDLAQAGNVTAKHLCRLFREHVEITPMEAVLALRLRHAVALLARTDFKLERIARECGFATSFHFSRRFREVYGKPPGAVRADLAAGRYQMPARLEWGNRLMIEYPV